MGLRQSSFRACIICCKDAAEVLERKQEFIRNDVFLYEIFYSFWVIHVVICLTETDRKRQFLQNRTQNNSFIVNAIFFAN